MKVNSGRTLFLLVLGWVVTVLLNFEKTHTSFVWFMVAWMPLLGALLVTLLGVWIELGEES